MFCPLDREIRGTWRLLDGEPCGLYAPWCRSAMQIARRARKRAPPCCHHSDDFTRAQVGDCSRVVAERGQHLIGVCAERGRHAIELAATMSKLEAATGEAQAAIGRVDLLDGAACRYLRVIDHFLDLPDAGTGRAGRLEDILPLARIFL